MKVFGLVLLLSGWAIVFAAVALLAQPGVLIAFLLAGVGVEATGLIFVVRSHPFLRGARE
jgi:uncharacterized membrane protein YraQ (UPF0718 family)